MKPLETKQGPTCEAIREPAALSSDWVKWNFLLRLFDEAFMLVSGRTSIARVCVMKRSFVAVDTTASLVF
jgi:hypothetical protein